ncbi:alpha-protein kinase 3 [Acanthochromis polyacanthus]|uniref:alpha-protein kinase 3 n=1 Tax=Acanthochromis polyacanthus TaxID=80966 RepID=UPI002234E32C|nr:alpha-protein kinase 3 [Acanthochromis polyacanthus]
MGSRRMTTRSSSSFGNGRSSNGNDVSGSSRPGGYSYLSNVRPENRYRLQTNSESCPTSTLCSVMAQLTEETQPFFETTLKSKAVSENCNVKFSCVVTGYPAPQVTWYKDDMQLDRFCGLPKYEIFRNGQNHSLHIYNCTVEDAAIYQASAINTKGIVSCSGVLEVGEMNEFKIHQRYFGKLKLKAENRRKEAEGKENQEPLRTISPDRTQRKRRSTMEAFLSTPSSTEDESNEENHHTSDLQLIKQDSSMVEECLKSDSLTTPATEPSPLLKKRNSVSPIPSATPQELALGARRKIPTSKAKPEEGTEATSAVDNHTLKNEVPTQSSKLSTSPVTLSVSPSLSRRSALLQPAGEQTSRVERRSPLLNRRKMASDTQTPCQLPTEEIFPEEKPAEKDKHNPFKAPQVIRKIRGETFADALGHLKLWCQFFNVLSDSTVTWYKNEEEIIEVKRSSGDETQVNLAIVQASNKDSGVYKCSITNEFGTDYTDILLSAEIMAGMSLREDLGVGEEIEMTPLIFNKGVADSGVWGNKFFGRIMMKESQIGDGCSHKVWRAKVIYGLEPVFESGNTCIIKVCNPIAYGGKEESCLVDRNLDVMKQECKIQNLAREYCKIFSAEARVLENFGPSLEVIPVYLMYRPANTVPYATVETDLTGVFQKYSVLDHTGRIEMRTGSEVEQKCCALQHWIFQWTNGNLLLTRLEGVDTKITNVGISVKSTGHQGLSVEGNPKVFEQFVSQHKCNYFCGLLGLRSLKLMDSLMTPVKPKGSRSPLLQRKMAAGSSSPQTGRKAGSSPRMPRKAEQDGRKTPTKPKTVDTPKMGKMV